MGKGQSNKEQTTSHLGEVQCPKDIKEGSGHYMAHFCNKTGSYNHLHLEIQFGDAF